MRDFSAHFRALLERQFPKGARILTPRGGTDLIMLASWKLPTTPGRAARRSRMVRLLFAREALKDYAAGSEAARQAADERLTAHCRAQLAAFDPDHASPPGVEPPSVSWPIDTLTLNGGYHDGALSLDDPDRMMVRVTYMELTSVPQPTARVGDEFIAVERLEPAAYLELYRSVGGPVGWDSRLKLTDPELAALLTGEHSTTYVVRDRSGAAMGFCEFDRSSFPQIELTHFGIVPSAQGKGLGPWLLSVALQEQWQTNPARIWLHTDTWDHPAAKQVFAKTGFQVFDVRDERADSL